MRRPMAALAPALIATLVLAAAAETRAQTPASAAASIKVGDGVADGSFLRPYDNVWLYRLTLPDGRMVIQGLWTDHLQASKVDGKDAWSRVQGQVLVDGRARTTLNVFDAKTLEAYVSAGRGTDGALFRREFKGGHVVSTRTSAKGETTTAAFDAPGPVFDFNGGMYGMVLAAMPLREGLTGTFPTVEEFDDRPAIDSFRVLRQEDVKAGSRGTVKAWVVESGRPGQYKMTFWLTKTAPYIIRLVYETPKKDSPVFTWDMI